MRLTTAVGIKEVQIIQWFVEPEARVEQFDKLCEVQSDKAATEVCEPLLRLETGMLRGVSDHFPLRRCDKEAVL